MAIDLTLYAEARRKFLANRALFPIEELGRYTGLWVAWNADGTRIAASAPTPELLERILEENGENPTNCVLEGIPSDATIGEADGSAA